MTDFIPVTDEAVVIFTEVPDTSKLVTIDKDDR
jgi:hypothetical protein